MNLRRHHVILGQINIPARCPRRLRIFPHDIVSVNNIFPGSHTLIILNYPAVHVRVGNARIERFGESLRRLPIPDIPPGITMRHAHGLHGKAHHAMTLLPLGIMILQNDIDVIVHERLLRILRDEPDGKSPRVMLLRRTASRQAHARPGQIVDDPVVVVAVLDVRAEGVGVDFGEGDLAEDLAVHFAEHVDGVGRVLDFVAGEELAQVFGRHFGAAGGAAEGEAVVVFGELGMNRSHGVHFHRNLFSGQKLMRPNAGNVKSMARFQNCHGQDRGLRQAVSEICHCY
mmetsp:Transcript_19316/g.36684  ORF Transcript_19316/g.36684 Transcript_19316/m.36684 type:complete len:286 (+) Transcript_19316:214-1071(+)